MPYITFDEFREVLDKHVKSGADFYAELLDNMIKEPERFCGLFRLTTNLNEKIIQNASQSKEIKFGVVLEELTTRCLENMGYTTFDKNLGKLESAGKKLRADQYFESKDGKILYLVEMKTRDDHDNNKNEGQYPDFCSKIRLIVNKNPDKKIVGIYWFVDDSHKKWGSLISQWMERDKDDFGDNVTLRLCYGRQFFEMLENGPSAWDDIINVLRQYHSNDAGALETAIQIPNFGTEPYIQDILVNLNPAKWNKLMSNEGEYPALRELLFSEGNNLQEAMERRKNK